MPLPCRVAVIGAGAFGKNHLRVLKEAPGAELAGVFDTDAPRAQAAAQEHGCRAYVSLEEAAGDAQAAVVATPTTAHAATAIQLMEKGLDVLVEKPIAVTSAEAQHMVDTAARGGRILQVGHLERFNPAVSAAENVIRQPLFFEIHRLSVFTPRSLDVDVVMDLMIHDLEIVLAFTRQMPDEVRAAGISVLSDKVDIANVRLAFPGGCVANLTASRVSTERVRKMRLFQPNQYISIDYAKQELLAIEVGSSGPGFVVGQVGDDRQIRLLHLPVVKQEPLKAQCDAFLHSIGTRERPKVSGEEACRALRVAENILATIEEHAKRVRTTLGR